jgi:hypothetical protein
MNLRSTISALLFFASSKASFTDIAFFSFCIG